MKRTQTTTNHALSKWAAGAAVGALAMYFADPGGGRRRRALVRDQVRSAVIRTSDATDVTMRDLGHRLYGLQARIRRALALREPAPNDQVITAGIRAKLGRLVAHPHAIEVAVQQGRVVISGLILAHEKPELIEFIRTLPGVVDVDDQLQAYPSANGVPGLQGSGNAARSRAEWLQENWPPALRGIAVVGGGLLGGYGLTRRNRAGRLIGAVGTALLARGLTNMSLKRMLGVGEAPYGIVLQKTIEINALPETVFDIWTSYENFPYFMSHVLEVRDLGDQRSHWIVEGPAGARIEWRAMQTEYLRPQKLAWRTEPDAPVEHHGSVLFEATKSGGTRVTVRMSYHPPAGAIGHAIASLLGRDPKHALDDDLMRMKMFVESGRPPHDAAAGPRGEGVLH